MEWKYIETNGISYIEPLDGNSGWYWGMDYTSGDLYEAEELYQSQNTISSNRLILVKFPEGKLYEPIKAQKGQYIGRPIYYGKAIYCLLVDFSDEIIIIYKCDENMEYISQYATIELKGIKDCYNLALAVSPLMLIRQGHENVFQIIWPEKVSFEIDSTESFIYRDGDNLIFSKWFEDPDYREEIIVRDFNGKIIKSMKGTLTEMLDGQKWILN